MENILEMNVIPFENLSSVLPEFRKYDTPAGGVIISAFTVSNNDSNGFQIRDSLANQAETYVYAAWAEQPMVNSKGVPNNAR